MHKMTIAELDRALRRGDFTSVELTRHFLDRIERLNPRLNAYITVDGDRALAAAERADSLRQTGEAGPLAGIPIAHKDIFCTYGLKTSCGSRMLDSFIAPYSATVVERLEQAGVVMLGKTNMDEFAMGSSNETSWYGPVKNPWDETRVRHELERIMRTAFRHLNQSATRHGVDLRTAAFIVAIERVARATAQRGL